MFNLTNAPQFLAGKEKAKLQQLVRRDRQLFDVIDS